MIAPRQASVPGPAAPQPCARPLASLRPRPVSGLERLLGPCRTARDMYWLETKFTGHCSVRRAVGRKRAVGGGATVAVLGRNGGSSAAHCG